VRTRAGVAVLVGRTQLTLRFGPDTVTAPVPLRVPPLMLALPAVSARLNVLVPA